MYIPHLYFFTKYIFKRDDFLKLFFFPLILKLINLYSDLFLDHFVQFCFHFSSTVHIWCVECRFFHICGYLSQIIGQMMTISEIADLRKHNDHLIMSFVIQAIVNIRKANHLIVFFIDLNPTYKFMQINC